MADQPYPDFLSASRNLIRSTGELIDTLRASTQATHRSIDLGLRTLKESREKLDRASQLAQPTSR